MTTEAGERVWRVIVVSPEGMLAEITSGYAAGVSREVEDAHIVEDLRQAVDTARWQLRRLAIEGSADGEIMDDA